MQKIFANRARIWYNPFMEQFEKNQSFTAEIDGWSSDGSGVCHPDGRAVFLPRTLPGERWEAKLVKVSAGAAYARAEKPLVLSPGRMPPACPHFGRCGGCDLMHMTYEEELRFKLDKVNAALRHIGKQSFTAEEILGAGEIYRYRNKAVFAVAETGSGPACGFYRERSHQLVPVEDCLLQSELSCRAAAALTAFMRGCGFPAYDEASGRGLVRHLFCRQAVRGTGAVVCVSAAGGFGAKTGTLVERLRAACPELSGIVLNVNKARGNAVLAGDFYTLWGEPLIRDRLLDLRFEIAPQAFFQVNPLQAERLYQRALDYAACGPGSLALDLYCGAGTISLCLAKRAGRVIGAEIVPQAVENARKNAAENRVENAEFLCADAGAAAEELAARGLRPEVIVTDPPRKGMDEAAVSACAAMAPERLVYVSCNPATLARDILRFNAFGYELRALTAVDMFPRTAHVETVVMLSHKKPDSVINVKVEFGEGEGKVPLDNIAKRAAAYKPKERVTYKMIKEYIEAKYGFKVHTAYIAEVKRNLGLPMYDAPNAVEELKQPRKHPTPEKVEAIKDALKHFEVI